MDLAAVPVQAFKTPKAETISRAESHFYHARARESRVELMVNTPKP